MKIQKHVKRLIPFFSLLGCMVRTFVAAFMYFRGTCTDFFFV